MFSRLVISTWNIIIDTPYSFSLCFKSDSIDQLFFIVSWKDSIHALSYGSPFLLILIWIPKSFNSSTYSCEQNCEPRSEWVIIPLDDLRVVRTILNASKTSSFFIEFPLLQPTIYLENRSMIEARYSHPSFVRMYVLSATQTVLGVLTLNCLLTKLG